MKRLYIIIGILGLALGIQAQEQETPNAKQAHRIFMDIYGKLFGEEGGTLHYKVNIIGIYKTEGTIWMRQKKSKFIDERYIAWNDDVTYYRLERKKNRVTIYNAHSDERDKYATKFKFEPDNYTYSIKDEKKKGIAITLKAKKGVKGIKEARVMLERNTLTPTSIRIRLGIFHTTIKISNFKLGGISDEMFKFPKEQYKHCEYVDKR
jgi:hypothetical protein